MRSVTGNVAIRAALGLVLALAAAVAGASPAETLAAARACTAETGRLERLACFDGVFDTPLAPVAAAVEPVRLRPADWRLAYVMEDERQPEDGALYRDAGQEGGQIVTLAALGATPPRPLLTVQCHNNITELALMLPRPLGRERVSLDLASAGGVQQQVWRVRDEGLVISAGRGLPAIRTLKSVLAGERLRFRSSESRLDGLIFDLAGLDGALAPLRQTCGW